MRAYANTPFGQVHYVDQGTGIPIVLMGPSKRSGRVFVDLASRLATRYRVLTPDTLGSGNSDALPREGGIPALARSMVHLLDSAMCEKAYFFGLHTGNKLAAAIAADAPERVAGVILCGHSHSIVIDQHSRNEIIGKLVAEYLTPPADDAAQVDLAEWIALYRRIASLWWQDGVSGAEGRAVAARAARAVVDLIEAQAGTRALYEANFAYDWALDLARIRCPTLVIEIATPEEDALVGRCGAAVLSIVSGATLATIEEARGHASTLENRAGELGSIIDDFIARATVGK